MGKAIIIDGDFSLNHIKQVNFNSDVVNISELTIVNKQSTISNTFQISISLIPSNTTQTGVYYTSSNTNIATVNSSGLVSVLTSGSVTFTVTSLSNNTISDSFTTFCSIPVTSISFTNKPVSITDTFQTNVNLIPINTSQNTYTFTSSDTNIATINSNGIITVLASGTVTFTVISLSNSNITDSFTTSCISSLLTNINFDNKPTSIIDSYQLGVTYTPYNTTQTGVTYTSSNTNIATVDHNGFITVLSSGDVTFSIISSINSNITDSFTATCSISVSFVPITSVLFNSKPATINSSFQTSNTITPVDTTQTPLYYTSSNNNVATINTNGLITVLSYGTVTFSVYSSVNPNIYDSFTSECFIQISSVNFTTKPTSITDSYQTNITLTPSNTTQSSVYYTSSNTNIATINSSGFISVLTSGTTTISVISSVSDIIVDSFTVDCISTNLVSMSFNSKPTTITGSYQTIISLTPTNTTQTGVYYTSSNTNIATISSSGLINVLIDGTVSITVISTYNPSITDSFTVECVSTNLVSISFNSKPTTITGSYQTGISLIPSNTTQTDVYYTSSNTNIATISSTGLINVISSGSVSFTVTSSTSPSITDSFTATCSLPVVTLTSITFNNKPTTISGSYQTGITLIPSNTTETSVSYASSDTNIATISTSGLITIVTAGTATFTVTSTSNSSILDSFTATCSLPVVVPLLTAKMSMGNAYTADTAPTYIASDVVSQFTQSSTANRKIWCTNGTVLGTEIMNVSFAKNVNFAGATTGNNTGIFPDAAMAICAATTSTTTFLMTCTVPNGVYNVKTFHSVSSTCAWYSQNSDLADYKITVNGIQKTPTSVVDNTSSLLTWSNVTVSNGIITIQVNPAAVTGKRCAINIIQLELLSYA